MFSLFRVCRILNFLAIFLLFSIQFVLCYDCFICVNCFRFKFRDAALCDAFLLSVEKSDRFPLIETVSSSFVVVPTHTRTTSLWHFGPNASKVGCIG